MTTQSIFVDGRPATDVDARDRGLQYGDGVFETMAVVDGRVCLLDAHLSRLVAGCKTLDIVAPTATQLRRELEWIAAELLQGVIKLIVTRGSGGRGYAAPKSSQPRRIVYCSEWPDLPREIKLRVCQTRLASGGSLAGIKHLNRLEQVIARNEWLDSDTADDGLMLDAGDFVIETTSANLFIVRDGKLSTPALARCGVSGVMRAAVMSLPAANQFHCHETDITLDDVLSADELFVTNAVIAVMPVVAVNDQRFPIGSVTQTVGRQLLNLLHRDLNG